MGFLTEVIELKTGLIIFRRGDVDHKRRYCRMKVPGVDRYKTTSLGTEVLRDAKEKALEQDADFRFRLKHNVPIFGKTFADVGLEYSEMSTS